MELAFWGGGGGMVTVAVNIALFIYSTNTLNSARETNLSKTLTVFKEFII